MKKKAILVGLIFLSITLFFFYPIFNNKVPFPGDLLIGEYAPYNSYPFLGYAPGSYPNKGQDFDVLRLLYPEKEFSIRMFKSLELPLWNPFNFSGNPHMASLQSGSFYPLNIIFFILPFISAWTIFIMLQPILVGIFTYLLSRELKLSVKSSIFSGILFSFSSYSIVWMEYGNIGHSILWMPFAMWMILKNLNSPSVIKSLIISIVLTFAILAGYVQTAFYVFVFIFAFTLFNIFLIDKKNKLKKILIFTPIFILPSLFSAMQIIPMVELIFQSARTPYSYQSFIKLLVPPFHIITTLVPDFFGNPATRNYWLSGTYIERVTYIGVVPIIFIIYSFFRKQNSSFWFFLISAIAVLILTFDTYLAQAIYFFQIPLISTAVPTRIIFIFCFSLSMLAGFGMDNFIKDSNKKIFIKSTLILGGIYLTLWIFAIATPLIGSFSFNDMLHISRRNLILPTGIFSIAVIILFLSIYFVKYRKYIIAFLLILSVLDLFYFFHKITPFAPKETIYPETEIITKLKQIQGIDRSWGYGGGYISTNLQTYEETFSPDGYSALHIKRYGELLSSSKDGKIASSVPRSDPVIVQGFGENDLSNNKYRQKILDLLGVKYVLNKNELLEGNNNPDFNTFSSKNYKLVWQKNPWQIYENLNALPRAFFVSDYIVKTNKEEIINAIFDENIDLKETVILEEKINKEFNLANDSNARVEVKEYTPNRIKIRTDSEEDMLLVVSDNYFPGWKVSIDGENGKIYRANFSLRAVPVENGKHEVIFSYYPKSFDSGIKISLTTIFLVIILLIIKRLKINV